MIDALCTYRLEEDAFRELKRNALFKKLSSDQYEAGEEKKMRVDLLGKSVRVGNGQFPDVAALVESGAALLEMDAPPVFVYEDFFYGVEAKGSATPWIEISAKTVSDFSMQELSFLVHRALYAIARQHCYYETRLEESIRHMSSVAFPGKETLLKAFQVGYAKWSRMAQFSQDQFGYAACCDVKASVQAVMKTILNSVALAGKIKLDAFMKQAETINLLNDATYNQAKLDERIPYGPYRIKNLIAFAVSEQGGAAVLQCRAGSAHTNNS